MNRREDGTLKPNLLIWAIVGFSAVVIAGVAGSSVVWADEDLGSNGAEDVASTGVVTPDSASPSAHAAGNRYESGVIIPITTDISDVTLESLERRIEQAKDSGANIIVFEMHTDGGMVSSALGICDLIKNLTTIKTVAWVHTKAYSAGSMISMACDEIVMAGSSVIGDCGVILGGPTGAEEVPEQLRAKAESPVLEQFRDSAARNGYNNLLCESLVVKERIVYWVENVKTGERRFIDKDDKISLLGGDEEDRGLFPSKGKEDKEEEPRDWRLVEKYFDPVAKAEIPMVQPVVAGTELLTMSQSRATAFGFCKSIVSDVDELKTRYNVAGSFSRLNFTVSERFTGWMTSMPVRMFLLLIIFLGVYVEFNTPGVGVPGLVALICLGIFVGAPYITGLANIWEIILIVAGFVLIAIEIFVIPGFGVAGVAGILCVLVGLLATFVPDSPNQPFPISWPRDDFGIRSLKYGFLAVTGSSVASIIGMIIFSRIIPKLSWMQGAIPLNPVAEQVQIADPYQGYARRGDVGKVQGVLRPSGKAWFGDVLVDVVAEGEFIEAPAEVVVVERSGNRVVVRKVKE